MEEGKEKKEYVKRDRPQWDESFMFNALWAAARSSCRHFQTGAVIARDKRIIATGYNGAPPNIENCLERGCRKDDSGVKFDDKGKGVCRGTHAEMNALSQVGRWELEGTSLYSVYFPCSACAKAIAGSGIGDVIYSRIYKEIDSLTADIFAEAGIRLRKFELTDERLERYFAMIRAIMK
jgi:dCMP deaminase